MINRNENGSAAVTKSDPHARGGADRPLVSVVIPTHNRAELLREALQSVYGQERVHDLFDIEVIVVDDASADSTPEVMREHPETRYIRFESNQGASAARNAGIRASTGKYVAFVDDDDLWLPHRLKAHVPVLEAHPDAGVVYGQTLVTGDGPNSLWPDAAKAPSEKAFEHFLMREWVLPVSVMIRRDAFARTGGFDENLRTMEHYEMFLRLAFHVPFIFVPGAVAIGRFSESGKWFTNIRAGSYEHILPDIVERWVDQILDPALRDELRRKARVAWFAQTTYWLERAGEAKRLRPYVIATLERNPWMVTAPVERSQEIVIKQACTLAQAAAFPIAAIRTFSNDIRAAVRQRDLKERLKTRRFLARMWTQVGMVLAKSKSTSQRRAGARAALCAVLQDPTQLRRRQVLKLLSRMMTIRSTEDSIGHPGKRGLGAGTGNGATRAVTQERVYSIGVYGGKSPHELGPLDGVKNPVLTRDDVSDMQAIAVADPFMIRVRDRWYMFFEVYERHTAKGVIGLATSDEGAGQWTYERVVLAEMFHLSYPYVFEWHGDYYMIPESHEAGAIRLYRARQFPFDWAFVGTLLNGPYFVDASIFRFQDLWWLLVETNPDQKHDTLRLYYADDLMGPWREHPKSPVVEGDARPAGRVVVSGDRLVRYAQDCRSRYGLDVLAFEITDLTARSYAEVELNQGAPVLTGSGQGWNASGMHHVDPQMTGDGRWLACVDGSFMGRAPVTESPSRGDNCKS